MKVYPGVMLAALIVLASTPGFTQPSGSGSGQISGQISVSGSRGQTRSGTYSGSVQRKHTPGQGGQQTHRGQITGAGGRTVGIDGASTTTTGDQGWQRHSSHHISGPQGTPLYHSECFSQGQRDSASRSCQTTVREEIYNTSSTITRTGPTTVDRQTTLSQDGQEIGGSQTTVTHSRHEGSFTKTVRGQTTSGKPINRTVRLTPNR
jgi:hypothetical protein